MRGGLQLTVLRRYSPLYSVLRITGRKLTIFEVFFNALIPSLSRPTRAPLTGDGYGSHSIYLTGGTHDMPIPPESAPRYEDGKVMLIPSLLGLTSDSFW